MRVQFGSDSQFAFPGVAIDNLFVSGDQAESPVIFAAEPTAIHLQSGFSGPLEAPWTLETLLSALGGDGAGRQFGFFADGFMHEFDARAAGAAFMSTFAAPGADVEGLAFDGSSLYAATAGGDLYTLAPDGGQVLAAVSVEGGGLFALAAMPRSEDPVPAPPPDPAPPLLGAVVLVAARGAGGFGGHVEVYDEQGRFQSVVDDPVLDLGVISDIELEPDGEIFVGLDLGANGVEGGLAVFGSNGVYRRFISLPDDTAAAGSLYPAGFDVLADGTLLMPRPNAGTLQHLDGQGRLLAERALGGAAPVDVALTDKAIIYTDFLRGQQFVNTASDAFGWMSFASTSDSQLFDPDLLFTDVIRAGSGPVDAQESADLSLFTTNAGDRTLRKLDAEGRLQWVVPTAGLPVGLAVQSGEVLRTLPFSLSQLASNVLEQAGAADEDLRSSLLQTLPGGSMNPGTQASFTLPDLDFYRIDLIAGTSMDVILAGQDGTDFSAESLELIGPDGATVIATAAPDSLGLEASNYDLAILDHVVATEGAYTLRLSSHVAGDYAMVMTAGAEPLVFNSEPDDAAISGASLRQLTPEGAALGFLGDTGPAQNLILDGGLEMGRDGPWAQGSTNFDSPICDSSCGNGNGSGAHDAAHWAWFGGTTSAEQSFLAQDVTFPNGRATLGFYLEIPQASGTGLDELSVSVDGESVFSVNDLDAGSFPAYRQVLVDVSRFADGAVHSLRFDASTAGPALSNFFVDDVTLLSGGQTSHRTDTVTMIRHGLHVAPATQDAGPDERGRGIESPRVAPAPVQEGPGPRLIVRYATGVSTQSFAAQIASQASLVRNLPLLGDAIYELSSPAADPVAVAANWQTLPGVLYAEPDQSINVAETFSDDPRFTSLWGLNNTGQTGGTVDADIDALEAWAALGGAPDSSDVVIASIDTDVDYLHPDLAPNMWRNSLEVPGDGIDNDGNGCVGDIHGIDTFSGDGDPQDDNGHGTHTAGTFAAATDNGMGVSGVTWNSRIMALKFLGADGSGSVAGAIELIEYMTAMRTRAVDPVNVVVRNNSWGGGGYSAALRDAIAASIDAGILFVAADGTREDNDLSPHCPSNYDLDGVISVAATDHNDRLASFSNHGAVSVDLAAPGVGILSTYPGGSTRPLSGTSMASPHVAGAAALLAAVHPGATPAELKRAILAGVDQVSAAASDTVSGGRLNVHQALDALGQIGPAVTSIDPPAGQVENLNIGRIRVGFSETLSAAAASSATNYRLLATGPDGTFASGAADDVTISLTAAFDGDATVELLLEQGHRPLTPGAYELTIFAAGSGGGIQDADGNPLNSTTGPGNGFDHVHRFDVVVTQDPTADRYAIELQADEAITFSTPTPFDDAAASPLNDLDPTLILFDVAGEVVASDADGLDGRNARLEFVAPTSGLYTVEIRAESGSGAYLLSATGGGGQTSQTVELGNGGAKQVVYTDADGSEVRISVSSGLGKIVFPGNAEVRFPRRGTIEIVTNAGRPSVNIFSTSSRTRLIVSARGGDGLAELAGLTTDGPIGTIVAGAVNFTGPMHFGGPARSLMAHALIDVALIIEAGLSQAGTGFGRTLPALGRAKLGAVQGGSWLVDGAAGSLRADRIENDWSATFVGSVKSLSVFGSVIDTWLQAASIVNLRVGGDLVRSNLTLTTPFDPAARGVAAIRSMRVGGLVDSTTLQTQARVGRIQAGAIHGSYFYVGFGAGFDEGNAGIDQAERLKTAMTAQASIDSIRITGLRHLESWLSDSRFAAWRIGRIGAAQSGSGGATVFAAATFGGLIYRDELHRLNFKARDLGEANETLVDGLLSLLVL